MEKIRYGIIGCGKHALNSHAIPGQNVAELELTAICDVSQNQLKAFENAYGQKLAKYNNKKEFLLSGISAVLIGTPDKFHYENLALVIESGLHAFVEKPIGVTAEEVKNLEALLEYAADKGIVISSCHPRRYDPPFVWLKKNLPLFERELGMPIDFRFDFSYHKPSKNWKQTRGLLLDHVNHEVDLMHYLFGHEEFEAIKRANTFDYYCVVGSRIDGINFQFSGTRKLNSRKYSEWASIRFDHGSVMLDAGQGVVLVNNHEDNSENKIKIEPTNYDLRGRETMANFAKAINETENCYLSKNDLYVNTAMSVMLTENQTWRYDGRNR